MTHQQLQPHMGLLCISGTDSRRKPYVICGDTLKIGRMTADDLTDSSFNTAESVRGKSISVDEVALRSKTIDVSCWHKRKESGARSTPTDNLI